MLKATNTFINKKEAQQTVGGTSPDASEELTPSETKKEKVIASSQPMTMDVANIDFSLIKQWTEDKTGFSGVIDRFGRRKKTKAAVENYSSTGFSFSNEEKQSIARSWNKLSIRDRSLLILLHKDGVIDKKSIILILQSKRASSEFPKITFPPVQPEGSSEDPTIRISNIKDSILNSKPESNLMKYVMRNVSTQIRLKDLFESQSNGFLSKKTAFSLIDEKCSEDETLKEDLKNELGVTLAHIGEDTLPLEDAIDEYVFKKIENADRYKQTYHETTTYGATILVHPKVEAIIAGLKLSLIPALRPYLMLRQNHALPAELELILAEEISSNPTVDWYNALKELFRNARNIERTNKVDISSLNWQAFLRTLKTENHTSWINIMDNIQKKMKGLTKDISSTYTLHGLKNCRKEYNKAISFARRYKPVR